MTRDGNALHVQGLCAGYGKFDVLHDVELRVGRGESVALLGPNGAGKTTLLNSIMGFVRKKRGRIWVDGVDVLGMPPHRIGRGYAAISPEGRRLFQELSVEDNLLLGALHRRSDKAAVQASLESVFELFPVLREYRKRRSAFLSGGEQQMVAIGRMLMAAPSIFLLDEPSIALAPVAVDWVVTALQELRRQGCSMLVVEQRVDVATKISDRMYVLASGNIVDVVRPGELGEEASAMIARYLG